MPDFLPYLKTLGTLRVSIALWHILLIPAKSPPRPLKPRMHLDTRVYVYACTHKLTHTQLHAHLQGQTPPHPWNPGTSSRRSNWRASLLALAPSTFSFLPWDLGENHFKGAKESSPLLQQLSPCFCQNTSVWNTFIQSLKCLHAIKIYCALPFMQSTLTACVSWPSTRVFWGRITSALENCTPYWKEKARRSQSG